MFSVKRWVAVVALASGVASLFRTAPAEAASAHPDPSGFPVPTLPDPGNGFGTALETACEKLPSLGATPAELPANAREISARDESGAAQTLVALKVICDHISKKALDDADLTTLRKSAAEGTLPPIAAALAGGATTAAAISAAVKKGAAGAAAGATPTASLAGFESNLLNGLADFLVTRSKEEALLYLQEQIAEKFCKDDAKILIPRTCDAILNLDASLSIAAIGTTLNAAARRDLALLPDGVLQVLSNHDTKRFGLYESLRLLYAVVLEVRGGRIPLEVARSIHGLPLRSCEAQSSPQGADLACERAFLLYRAASALIYGAQANEIDQVVQSLPNRPVRITGTLIDVERFANTARVAANLTRPPNEQLRLLAFDAKTMNGALEAVGIGRVLTLAGQMLGKWNGDQRALTSADSKGTPADRRRLLGNAVFDTMTRIGQLAGQLAPFVDKAIGKDVIIAGALLQDSAAVGRDVANEDYGSIPLDVNAVLTDLGAFDSQALGPIVNKARTFLPVITEIAAAKSSADVAAALDAAAAPASSYRAKYQRPQVNIGAFVGALVGGEKPNDPHNDALGDSKASGIVAGFAPVGVEATAPLGSKVYTGLMLSIIDIGALTTARFKQQVSDDETVKTETNVTFTQVFSPGLYAAFGLFGSPFVAGGGVSYAPELRSLEKTDPATGQTTSEKVSAFRYGAFLAVDVTIFPL